MKTFCPHCGNKMEYVGKKPNFCYSCGHAFAGASESVAALEEEPEQIKPTQEQIIPNITKLDVEITQSTQNKFKFGEVVGTLNPDNIGNDEFVSDGKPSPEQQMKDFQREAGTLREKK